jgi:hypothetical protein
MGELIRIKTRGVYLRSQAGIEGEVLAELAANSQVLDLGEVSSFVTAIQREGINYEAPWIKVQNQDGQQGWIFAALDFVAAANGDEQFLLEKHMEAALGKQVAEAYQYYQLSKDSMYDAQGLLNAYQALRQLKSVCQQQINQSSDIPSSTYKLPELLPELIVQRDPLDQSITLYLDYRYWWNIAEQTPDSLDNAFVDVCITAYPEDSIEYKFPAWFFQTTPNSGHSLLGRGIHLEMFEKINNLLNLTGIFKEELLLFKNTLIEDIIFLNTTYWEEKELVEKELKKILDRNYAFLDGSDRLALQNRMQAFQKGKESEILFNFKSGIH